MLFELVPSDPMLMVPLSLRRSAFDVEKGALLGEWRHAESNENDDKRKQGPIG